MSNIARFESFLQISKALDKLNKLRNFVYCTTTSLLRVQRAYMCYVSELPTVLRAEAECYSSRNVFMYSKKCRFILTLKNKTFSFAFKY